MATWIDQMISTFLNDRRKKKRQCLPLDALGSEWSDAGPGEPWDIPAVSRLRHLYLLGCTGCGKTNLLTQLVQRDIESGQSVAVLDMRGDLVDQVLNASASKVDHNRFHLIDLRNPELSLGLNPFRYSADPYSAALQVHGILHSAADSWGVQLDETLRCALIVLSYAKESLTDLPKLLTDSTYRDRLVAGIPDTYVGAFFGRFETLSPDKQMQWVLPVLNKVSGFLAHPSIRSILAEKKPIDLPGVLDTPGSILLVSLGADRLHGLAGTFGCMAVSAIENSVMKRVDQTEWLRNPVHLYLDEFENFQSPAFESIIAEGRRFRLGLTLSHQNLHQLDSRLRHVVLNNAGTRIYFRTGVTDASELGRELSNCGIQEPVKALFRLPVGHAFVTADGGEARHIVFRKAISPGTKEAARNSLLDTLKSRSKLPSRKPSEAQKKAAVEHVRKPRAAGKNGGSN